VEKIVFFWFTMKGFLGAIRTRFKKKKEKKEESNKKM